MMKQLAEILTCAIFMSADAQDQMHIEQPNGVVPVTTEQGTHPGWLTWLGRFRGRLLPGLTANPRQSLQSALLTGWASSAPLMRGTFPNLTDRQRFITYITMRVGGSFTTYSVRSTIPNQLSRLLLSHRGNCSDYAVRLAMALDSVGVDTAIIFVNTPSTPGHVIVDAYDEVDGSGYLIDPLFHVVLRYEAAGISFMTKWAQLTDAKRISFFDAPGAHDLMFIPTHFRFVDGGVAGFTNTPVTDQSINSVDVTERRRIWRRTMIAEWPKYLLWWKTSYPNQPPRSLADLGSAFGIAGISEFGPLHAVPTLPLWQASGLIENDPGVFKFQNTPPLED
jgi:hypothetical protein